MSRQRWGRWKGILGALVVAAIAAAAPAYAQLEIGDNVKMTMNGTLGFGYSGDLGNGNYGGLSSHSLFITGMGTLNGSYYNPNFLSFTVQPFYNRNQDSSALSSVFSDTGINASVNLFSGSHFPGSVSYSRALTTGSQYGLPGGLGLSSNDSSQTFTITWSEFIPNKPSLTATFSDSTISDTILGEVGRTDNAVKTLNLFSAYRVAGFVLNGQFNHQTFNTTLPAFLAGTAVESDSSSNTFNITVNHQLPLSGSFTAGFMHSAYNTDTLGIQNDGAANTLYGNVGLNPTNKLGIDGGIRYYSNLVGALQGIIPGGSVPIFPIESTSNGLVVNAYASYNLGHNVRLVGYVNRATQHYADQDYISNQYGATLTYSYARPLLGMLYFSFGTVDTTGNGNQGTLAFVGSLGLKKQFRSWEINADASYSQNVQNSTALFTTSNYNFGGYLRKRFGDKTYFSASAREVATALTQISGYGNRAETFMATLSRGRVGFSGSYAMSHGTSVLTTAGLAPGPVPPNLAPDQVLYNGKVYGVGVSVIPLRRMVVNVTWYRSYSDTLSPTVFSNNSNNRLYGQMQYNLRKLQFRATYWRVNQLISSAGLPNTNQNSYSFTVSRWFNLF